MNQNSGLILLDADEYEIKRKRSVRKFVFKTFATKRGINNDCFDRDRRKTHGRNSWLVCSQSNQIKSNVSQYVTRRRDERSNWRSCASNLILFVGLFRIEDERMVRLEERWRTHTLQLQQQDIRHRGCRAHHRIRRLWHDIPRLSAHISWNPQRGSYTTQQPARINIMNIILHFRPYLSYLVLFCLAFFFGVSLARRIAPEDFTYRDRSPGRSRANFLRMYRPRARLYPNVSELSLLLLYFFFLFFSLVLSRNFSTAVRCTSCFCFFDWYT